MQIRQSARGFGLVLIVLIGDGFPMPVTPSSAAESAGILEPTPGAPLGSANGKSFEKMSKAREVQGELAKAANRWSALSSKERKSFEVECALRITLSARTGDFDRELLELLVGKWLTAVSDDEISDATIVALAHNVLFEKAPELRNPAKFPGYGYLPAGTDRLRFALERWTPLYGDFSYAGDLHSLALAAIDSYNDARAFSQLLVLARANQPAAHDKQQVVALKWLSLQAWQFLLNYRDGRRCLKPAFENAFEGMVNQRPSASRPRESYLCQLLPSIRRKWLLDFDYMESLPAASESRYIEIRRLLFRADALAPGCQRPAPTASSGDLLSQWREGDEQYVPQLFEVGRPFGDVIGRAPISDAGLAWLRDQITSDRWSERVRAKILESLQWREERRRRYGGDFLGERTN